MRLLIQVNEITFVSGEMVYSDCMELSHGAVTFIPLFRAKHDVERAKEAAKNRKVGKRLKNLLIL